MRGETLHFRVVRPSELNEQFQSAALDYLRLAIGAESFVRESLSDLALQLNINKRCKLTRRVSVNGTASAWLTSSSAMMMSDSREPDAPIA
jgi:hypothetical protein